MYLDINPFLGSEKPNIYLHFRRYNVRIYQNNLFRRKMYNCQQILAPAKHHRILFCTVQTLLWAVGNAVFCTKFHSGEITTEQDSKCTLYILTLLYEASKCRRRCRLAVDRDWLIGYTGCWRERLCFVLSTVLVNLFDWIIDVT